MIRQALTENREDCSKAKPSGHVVHYWCCWRCDDGDKCCESPGKGTSAFRNVGGDELNSHSIFLRGLTQSDRDMQMIVQYIVHFE